MTRRASRRLTWRRQPFSGWLSPGSRRAIRGPGSNDAGVHGRRSDSEPMRRHSRVGRPARSCPLGPLLVLELAAAVAANALRARHVAIAVTSSLTRPTRSLPLASWPRHAISSARSSTTTAAADLDSDRASDRNCSRVCCSARPKPGTAPYPIGSVERESAEQRVPAAVENAVVHLAD